MRIIHVSDLHADGSASFERRLRSFLEIITQAEFNHLVITGDLTQSGRDFEYKQVADVLREYDLSSADRLSVIPGNHDLYSCIFQQFSLEEAHNFHSGKPNIVKAARKALRIARAIFRYSEEEYAKSVELFMSYFKESFEGTIPIGKETPGRFPRVKLLEGGVSLVLVDSNYLVPTILFRNVYRLLTVFRDPVRAVYNCGQNLFGSNGWVDLHDMHRALAHEHIREARKLIVMHHALYTRPHLSARTSEFFAHIIGLGTSDAECRDRLCHLFEAENVDLVLHGHWHTTERYDVGNRPIGVLNGGAGLHHGWDIRFAGDNLVVDPLMHDLPEHGIPMPSTGYG